MDAIIPSLPDPVPTMRRNISYYIAAFILLAAIFGATFWYGKQNKQVGPAFDPARQVVPKGTAPLDVPKALTAFNFSKPLPFFEKENVVQSIDMGMNASVLATSSVSSIPKSPVVRSISAPSRIPPPQDTFPIFLSYRIFGQSKEAIRGAFIEHFKNMGWKMASTSEGKPFLFSSNTHQTVSVTLLDAPAIQGTSQPAIVAALIVQ